MPIRPSGIPKQQTPAAPSPDLTVAQQVTTGSDGRATVTFAAAVDAASVQASSVDAAGTAVVVNVESVVGAVVKVRSYRAGTLFAAGAAVVNVTARKVTA